MNQPEPTRSAETLSGEPGPRHDPTGTDLAHWVAGSIANYGPAPAPRAQPRTGRSYTESARKRAERRAARQAGAEGEDRDPRLIGDLVEKLASSRGWTTKLNVHVLLGKWAILVGEVNAAHSQPQSFHDGVIRVQTDTTAWATQMRYLAPQIVARLNQALGDGTVSRIEVLGPNVPKWTRGKLRVRGRGPRDTYG